MVRGGARDEAGSESGTDGLSEVPVWRGQWATLAALSFVFISNQWSRSLLFYLVSFGAGASTTPGEFMNIDLGFDQTQYSLLASFGFTSLFALTSLAAGRVADQVDRAAITTTACLVWAGATVATGFAPSFYGVLLFRIIQGVSQGFTNPAAFGILSDTFPPERRATANALFSSGIYIGGGLASLSVLIVGNLGWRSACLVVGSVSFLAALVSALVVRDPGAADRASLTALLPGGAGVGAKGAEIGAGGAATSSTTTTTSEGEQDGSDFLGTVGAILSNPTMALLFLASAIRFCAGFGIGVWAAPYFRESFPDQQALFGVTNALVVGIGGFTSSLVGGAISDKLNDGGKGDPGARAWLMAGSSALAVPAWAAVVLAPSFVLAQTFLFFEYLVAECWFGPAVAVLQDVLPPSQRGTAQGIFSMLTTVGNIAPVAIGAALSADVPLRDALLVSVPACYAAASLGFVAVGFSLRTAAEAKAEKAE